MYIYMYITHAIRCICPEGFTLNSVFNECVDENECAGNNIGRYVSNHSSLPEVRSLDRPRLETPNNRNSNNVCGNAQCQNSFGSYSCICPGGSQYDSSNKVLKIRRIIIVTTWKFRFCRQSTVKYSLL